MKNWVLSTVAIGFVLCAGAQSVLAQRNRIATQVDRNNTVTLRGHVHPAANAANDRGRADASMAMPNMTLLLTPSADQQTALEGLLARQQDPSSPDYHQWLTPEQYADRFGLSQPDIAKITSWLQSEGLTVISTARGRNSITVRGTAGLVEKTFHTEIHRYMVEGKLHYANATEPSIPAAFSGVIGAIRGLHDFTPKPRPARISKPRNTVGRGTYQIAPDDAATIYDYKALYSQKIDGTGQKIVIVGQVQIDLADIASFRTAFNLPVNVPQLVSVPGLALPLTGAADPGDLGESDLDIETAGGVARGATVIFVYSANVDDAVTYAIDQVLAPVISSSYGLCEAQTGQAYSLSQRTQAQQANLQGITWVVASGDNGAADCYDSTERSSPGLGVDEPGTIPEVTSVGGTEFNEASGNYWNSTNDANQASAKSYIPETTWNDSVSDGSPSASGGGASTFFSRPSWQAGTGTFSSDSMRDVPDISFSSSADHDGWLIYSGGNEDIFGGTSVAAPLFGGILTLLNHYQVANGFQKTPGLGNVNPKLYAMAASAPGAFHDITTGNSAVDPCGPRARTCDPTAIGYNAGVGYDMATGLGSIDVFNLFTAWNGGKAGVTLSLSSTVTSSVTLTATVTGSNSTTPTGTITWSVSGTTLGSKGLAGPGSSASASLTNLSTSQVAGGATITVTYSGDSNFNATTGSQTVSVPKVTPTMTLSASQPTFSSTGSSILSATVAGSGGITPTGSVTWSDGTLIVGTGKLSGSGGTATAKITIFGFTLASGNVSLTAVYNGDVTYNSVSATQTVTVTSGVGQVPAITSSAAVVSAASYQAGITSNAWIAITGTNLSSVTDTWSNSIVGGQMPTKLDGVSVLVGGQAAYVEYVSSGQINVLAPNVPAGSVSVTVTTANGTSSAVTVTAQAVQPAFFQWGNYAVATGTDYSYLVNSGTFSGLSTNPAKPGQIIILWGTGFGPTSPAVPAGALTPSDQAYSTASPVTVTIGGTSANVLGAALTPGAAGLYQIAVEVPSSLGNADWPVVAKIAGVQSPSTTLLTVHN